MRTATSLTTNYRAILDYNCSNFYAISVGVAGECDCAAIEQWRRIHLNRAGQSCSTLHAAPILLATAASFSSPAPLRLPRRRSIRPPGSPILIDLSSGAVLYAKNADARMPPASMAKMMTTDVAFELIDKGQLPSNKMCTVRPETWQKWHGPAAGSTMFLSPTSRSASKTS